MLYALSVYNFYLSIIPQVKKAKSVCVCVVVLVSCFLVTSWKWVAKEEGSIEKVSWHALQ
jgi:hypothetical protein